MRGLLMCSLAAAAGLNVGLLRPSPALRCAAPPFMQSEYEKYLAARKTGKLQGGTVESTVAGYVEFNKYDKDFDGGDSGGGVVGDGNTDLEDQHNSATLGANRGGVSDLGSASSQVGRGRVTGATESRIASAGKNYFGRTTGYAAQKIEEITDDDLKTGRLDCVRAQQLENWFNQRAIHQANRAQGQGVVHGERKHAGHYIAREAIASDAWRNGAKENEVSQRDLADHLKNLQEKPAERLDGEAWQELVATPADSIEQTFEIRSSPRTTHVTDIAVANMFNTFAPYRAGFTADSSIAFSATPTAGTMNRRTGEPIEVTVRFTPEFTGPPQEATLVFETEDFKKVYKFIGST